MTRSARLSPYEVRVELVAKVVAAHSSLDTVAARELAVRVLAALNSIPEKIR